MEKVLKKKKFNLDGRKGVLRLVQEGKKKAYCEIDLGAVEIWSANAKKLRVLSELFADFAFELEKQSGRR